MKQKKLIRKMYQACLTHDVAKQKTLYFKELHKIFKHRAEGKSFTPSWTVVQ